jgi:putative membrane protein
MAFGFVIERFSLFLAALRHESELPTHHLFSLLVGVALIFVGAGVAIASSISYRGFVKSLPGKDVSSGYLVSLGAFVNLAIAAAGFALAIYLLAGAFQTTPP